MTVRDRAPRPSTLARIGRLALLGVSAAVIYGGTRHVSERGEQLRVVATPTAPPEGSDGLVRGLATFEPYGALPVPPCKASWKKGKNTNTTFFSGDNRVRFADGSTRVLPEDTKIELFRNEDFRKPQKPSTVTSGYLATFAPGRSYFDVQCVGARESLWVEACTRGDQLVACKGADAILLTPGGSALRVTHIMSHAHGALALALLGVIVASSVLVSLVAFPRKLVDDLAKSGGVAPHGGGIDVMMALPGFAALVSLSAWETTYGPWVTTALIAVVAVAALAKRLRRARVLGAARGVVIGTETAGLHDARVGERELAVRVASDAPPVEGFSPGRTHAAVWFRVHENYARKNGSKTTIASRPLTSGVHPAHVAIEDRTGRGALALTHCTLDVPDEPRLEWDDGMPRAPSWLASVTGPLERDQQHRKYWVEWRAIDAGEPLLLYGGVERVSPSTVGQEDRANYRTAPDVPLVRGHAEANILAFVGDEPTLVSALSRERVAQWLALAITAVATAGFVYGFVWILERRP